MKKNLLFGVVVLIMCFLLVGCGNTDTKTNDETETKASDTTNSGSSTEDIKLYSDDTKYVFELNNIKYVFYYKGDEITAYHTYVEYADSATATAANAVLSVEDLDGVDKHYVKGKYIILEYNKSEYEDLSVSELKTIYSYMKEVKKNE